MSTLEKNKRNIKYLEFELNNQCQYAQVHTWCPRNKLGTEPYQELHIKVIESVMDQFQEFNGTVYFSNYNEPTLDKRFLELITIANLKMPECRVDVFTNGLNMTVDKANQLFDYGITLLNLSAYSELDKERLTNIANQTTGLTQVWDRTYSGKLGYDDRIKIYDRDLGCVEPCYMPIQYFMICCNGNVIPCFDDWQQTVVFGNVYEKSVDEILMNPLRLTMIEELKKGDRHYSPCRGCNRDTFMCLQDHLKDLEL